jgi:4-hydroxyproline epimerase
VHRIETPVGVVTTTLHDDGRVSVENVPSWRTQKQVAVPVELPGLTVVHGDVAWGGNWFFLTQLDLPGEENRLKLAHTAALTTKAEAIRRALNRDNHPEVDHVEIFGHPQLPGSHSRNFVLCPGSAYDRSPCGTGTSAKLACLAADGKLAAGEEWVQESILGTTFTGTYRWLDQAAGKIIPTITGQAYMTGESRLLLDDRDPFCWGIR